MKIHTFTCIKCPLGCQVELTEENGTIIRVEGHTCKQGEQYAIDEFENPVRTVTTTVRVKEGILPVLPVRSENPLPKHLIKECVNVLSTAEVEAPVTCGDVVYKNILDTGVDIIASRDMEKE